MIDYKVLATSQRHRPVADFWRSRIAGLASEGRVAAPTAAPESRRRHSMAVAIDDESVRVLEKLAADPLGRFTALTAALALVIARYFNQERAVFRTPLLASSLDGLDDPPEPTLNPDGEVPLVFTVAAEATLRQLLHHVADVVEQSYSFQEFPVRALLLGERGTELAAISDFSVSCSLVHHGPLASPAPIHFNCDRLGENRMDVEWDPDAIEPFVVSTLAEMTSNALARFSDLGVAVGDVERLPDAQRRQLLVEWNDTATAAFPHACVHQLFERQAARTPDAPAVRFGDDTISYAQLNRSANRIAHHLLERSTLRSGAVIAVWMHRSPSMIAAVLGILKASLAYVPIDADCPPGRLEYILQDSGAQRLVIDSATRAGAARFGCELVDTDRLFDPADSCDANPVVDTRLSDLAYIIYTSGSTGQPKGCAIEHRSLSNYVQWAIDYYWAERDAGTMGLFSPLSFDLTITSVFCPLLRGQSVVVYPQTSSIEDILRHQFEPGSSIDTIKLTPSHIRLLDALRIHTTNIRRVIVGGEELTPRHLEILTRIDPRLRVFNEYGPTEATVGCVVKEVAPGEPIAIGRPIANTRAYVLDDEQKLVSIGVRGEICISGEGLARGYYGRQAATSTRFVPHPFAAGERLYRTGDVGRWTRGGELESFGRLDDQVKIRGYRVELGEVEAALRACDGVGDAVVAVNDVAGQDDGLKELVAYVVADGALDTATLPRRLAARLPDYMVPSAFVGIAAVPLTPNGKVDRQRLPQRAPSPRSSTVHLSLQGREEQALVRIWQAVFRVDGIGVDDDFFELGGHSLRAMQMMMRIQQELGVEVSLNDVFRSPTVAQLAVIIRQAAPSGLEPIRPLPPAEHYAVSHGQKRLWILNQLEENAAAYNVSSAFELAGGVDVPSLERAFRRLIDRHESLRTTFELVDGEPRQRIHAGIGFALLTIDASAGGDPEERARQIARADALGPFDLLGGPLVRATLVTLGPSRFVLVLTMHHIVTDEWSFGVAIEDLVELYRRERAGIVEPLEPLPIQYKDFAAWQRTVLAGGAAERHRRYWLDTLAGELPPLDLPADLPRRAIKSNAGSRERFSLDAATTAGLKALGGGHGASLFITLVAIVKVLLHRYTGQEEIRVGIPIAGRTQAELAGQVGFYLNTLVLRDRLRADQSFKTVLAGVTETATDAYEHDVFPFDRLVEELGTSRDRGRLRLFDVLVVQGNAAPLNLQRADLTVRDFDTPIDVSKFDLSFQFEEDAGGLLVELQYDTDLFLPNRMRLLRDHFATLAACVLADPAAPIGSLEIGELPSFAPNAIAGRPALEIDQPPYVAPVTQAEIALAAIWNDVLGMNGVGVHDNFFELGGDSIIALQIVSRALKAGFHLSLKQLFRHPTIAELAPLAQVAAAMRATDPAGAGSATGRLPLTPMQRWFFDLRWLEPSHFNQAVLLEVSADLDSHLLSQAVQQVFAHHDALGLRVVRSDDGWEQSVDVERTTEMVIVESQPGATSAASFIGRCEEIQRSLDISNGPLARVALFEADEHLTGRLLVVIHHFAVDGVSWRILLEDLMTAYGQLRQDERVALPPSTLSFREWAHRLQAWSDSPAVKADVEYWVRSSACGDEAAPAFQPDVAAGASGHDAGNTVRTEDHVSIRLDESETTALLKHVPRAYNTQINDVLLTALALAFAQTTGQSGVRVDLEAHGRDDLFGDADVSRTVGWFTSMFPVTLALPADPRPGDALKAVKETLRDVPSRGMSYGLLRYLTTDAAVRERMQALVPATIRFNYLGQTDATFHGGPWRPASEANGASQSPVGRRAYLLDVVAMVTGGRLEVDLIFSRTCHERDTIARLAEAFQQTLHALIAHCTAPGAGGFTPSDFPAASITSRDLDRLVQHIGADRPAKPPIADVFDLTPTQQGMLFHSALAEDSGVYVEQWLFSITGDLDAAALRRAWQHACERHAVLRTAFFWREVEQPVQVVFAGIDLPWDILDWRGVPDPERPAMLRQFLEHDRRRGLDLARAPLMRCTLIQVAADAYSFCWTSHHILMDGWSRSIALQDVITTYQDIVFNRPSRLAPARPFRSYVERLRERDPSRSEGYWRTRLDGFTTPTPLPQGSCTNDRGERFPQHQERLSVEVTRELARFARRHHLTMNTLVTAAWALVLSGSSRSLDVVCGATLGGRPPALDGADAMVGLFINTLPVRVRIDPQAHVLSWLHGIQTDQADLDQHADSSLVDVQRFSGVPRGLPLFESIVVFENYPVERSLDAGSSRLRIDDLVVFEQTNYPLTFVVVPDEALLLRLKYDAARCSAAQARLILRQVQELLGAFVRDPHQRLAALLSMMDATGAQRATVERSGAPAHAAPHSRARLDTGLTAQIRAFAARRAVPVRSVTNALAAALHVRYSVHEEIVCTVDGTPVSHGDIGETESFDSWLTSSGTGGTGAAKAVPYKEAVPDERDADLAFSFEEDGDWIALDIRCATGRFDEDALRGVHGHFRELALGALRTPGEPIARLTLLPDDERTRLIETFNHTARTWGHSQTIVELFEERVALHPDRVAVIVPCIGRDDGRTEETWTYGELNARANQLARYLVRHHGVGPDVDMLVGVMAERSFEMVLALMAILKAGGAYVPLDPEHPQARLAFMIEDSGATVLLTQETFRAAAAAFTGAVIFADSDWPAISAEPDGRVPARVSGDSLAYMIYTSGSTGRPKGAMNTHRGIANRLLWMQDAFGLNADDRVLQKTPFSFDVSVWEFFWPLMTGAQLVMAMPGQHGDSRYLVDVIEGAAITTVHFVPSMLHAFLDEPDLDRCRRLKRVICSGEAISPELVRRFESRFAVLDVPLHNLYGPTEAAVDVTAWPCDAASVRSVVPIGKPIANTELYILDQRLQPMPIGFAGELFIGGAGVGRGYLNRPGLTAEKYVPDPFGRAGARLYRTGDLSRYRPDGTIEFLGRLDHQVKLRGFRIELGEIESALLAHQAVRECVVIVREDQPDAKRLVAYVVPRVNGGARETGAFQTADIRAFLRDRLPDYMVPPVIVPLADLPRLPNGKLDRHSLPVPEALRDRRAGRADHASAPRAANGATAARARAIEHYVPPRTDAERTLTRLWQEVLGVEPVGVTDDYFELGGHSILALTLMSRIQIAFGRTIPLAHLFAHPTVERLADAIAHGAGADDWRPLVSIRTRRPGAAIDTAPPLFFLPGAGGNVIYFYNVAHALRTPRAIYGLQAIGLDGLTPPLTSVADIAATNIEEIRRVQPAGPYFLAGHSFGGKVALEMSQQLRERGEAVGLLAILDTAAPIIDPIAIGGDWQDAHWLAKIAREIEEFFGIALDVTAAELLPLPLEQQLEYVADRLRGAGWWAPGADTTPLRGYLQVYKANTQTEYVRHEPIDRVPIALFTTIQSPAPAGDTPPALLASMQQPAWGWDRFASGDVAVFEVPGDHLSMLADPNVQLLARAIDAALEKSTVDGSRDAGQATPARLDRQATV